MVTFSHLDPGTPESVWTDAFASHEIAPMAEDFERLIVVAAHPDDESLGAAGIMARTARRGAVVEVVVVTDGEGSHPESATHTPEVLARVRREEVSAALAHIGTEVGVHFLGLPDGGTDNHRDDIGRALDELLARSDVTTLVLSPWTGDGHRDHRVVGDVVADVCRRTRVRHRAFPIWLWHWADTGDAPWEDLEVVVLSEVDRDVKRAANREHVSQIRALSAERGDEPVLHEGMRAHFERGFEVFVVPASARDTLPRRYFEDFYARNADPWGFDTRWYEERKRRVMLSALPRDRYDAALELGCSTGAFTVHLADRAERLVAVDIAPAALDAARKRLGPRESVELRRVDLPSEWPEGRFDLIVLSEVGYYWSAADLAVAIRSLTGTLARDGHLVACHWRHPVSDYPATGDEVHAALRAAPALRRLVHHEEDDFILEVFERLGTRSVAAETGLVS